MNRLKWISEPEPFGPCSFYAVIDLDLSIFDFEIHSIGTHKGKPIYSAVVSDVCETGIADDILENQTEHEYRFGYDKHGLPINASLTACKYFCEEMAAKLARKVKETYEA